MRKSQLSICLDPELFAGGPGALRDGPGKTEGAGCRGCVASFLSSDDSDRRGAAIAKLLDRIVRVLELLERN